ncbi:dihydropteroate synthase [Geosporobacter ferrireducens]|uniref:Dihydropteroate synthase n=1 Tax=Geosporobacter ferrireducens TaxID=1424294 RepID=A0A1D8GNU7_9FIRM|nr:dihydropteroate synthase [Geosporobacter ferrireducens]AOT72598.1 dihydropteroate synthase [Geosporobacter ferrireducens]MTI54998.1 dihydropteroate synthase [Geosporobacter ferrireducens]
MRGIQRSFNRDIRIKCGNDVFQFGARTYIMGILNVTPDSFSDGGSFTEIENAILHAANMVEQGAHIIDVGGESTRPGAAEVSAEEELNRVLPVVKELIKAVKVPISVDTYKAEVAEQVLKAGAHIINDVWGLQRDPDIAGVIAKYDVPVIIMHNQQGSAYQIDIMEEIKRFLMKSIDIALQAGIKREHIILDPGIGFGKMPEQNVQVMARLGELNDLGYPWLLGTSRKSMLGKILDLPPAERVEGTVATSVMGIIQGADILRVHDVKENLRAAQVTDAIVRGTTTWIK